MRIKICGICQPEQGYAIAELGIKTLGFICVPSSPRYVTAEKARQILEKLPPGIQTIGVFADASLETIEQVVLATGFTGIQLHGNETTEFCREIKQALPNREIIKALRIQSAESLQKAIAYYSVVDALLLDAYHPQQLGGTGQTLPWESLKNFKPPCPWLLAGGLTSDNVLTALSYLQPDGIDLSSGVERSPGNKDLNKISQLIKVLKNP
ncbi:MAG: phosphoribosylanthranilate isomerase [Snowella sp.]|jgi:phosphoribosylanthranilate isomerase|nr:MAG: phosphoribosylanthranilate isomerase [Snowella sp.]